eukprot:2821291-Prymnesium_polylepis.1
MSTRKAERCGRPLSVPPPPPRATAWARRPANTHRRRRVEQDAARTDAAPTQTSCWCLSLSTYCMLALAYTPPPPPLSPSTSAPAPSYDDYVASIDGLACASPQMQASGNHAEIIQTRGQCLDAIAWYNLAVLPPIRTSNMPGQLLAAYEGSQLDHDVAVAATGGAEWPGCFFDSNWPASSDGQLGTRAYFQDHTPGGPLPTTLSGFINICQLSRSPSPPPPSPPPPSYTLRYSIPRPCLAFAAAAAAAPAAAETRYPRVCVCVCVCVWSQATAAVWFPGKPAAIT